MTIKSFADQATVAIFCRERGHSRARSRLPVELWDKANEILDALDGAEHLREMRVYDLSQKKGDRSGQFSFKINDQYRICFEWDDGDAKVVEVVDYH